MLKELEDYNWFPAILRRWQMQFIGSIAVWAKLYRPLIPILQKIITDNKCTSWQDVCSGGGMPVIFIHNHLSEKIPLLLTDKYPPVSFNNVPMLAYASTVADVNELEPSRSTVYTMFNALHHFSARQQNELLKKFSSNSVPFLFAEILEPGIFTAVKIFFTGTIIQLLTAPFIKPFSLTRLFFTWIIPVNLLTVTYDGIISVARAKTARQYQEQFKHISTSAYAITVIRRNNWKGGIVYIKGAPVSK